MYIYVCIVCFTIQESRRKLTIWSFSLYLIDYIIIKSMQMEIACLFNCTHSLILYIIQPFHVSNKQFVI